RLTGFWIDLKDTGAHLLRIEAILGGVAVRANGRIQLCAVFAGDNIFRPVVVDWPTWKIRYLFARGCDLGCSILVFEAQDRIGVGHVKITADQSHSKWRGKIFPEERTRFGDAVVVLVWKEGDPVGAWRACANPLLHRFVDPPFYAFAIVGALGTITLCDENISVRQYEKPTRMLKVFGKRIDREARFSFWLAVGRPALGQSNMDRRNN